VSRTRQCATVTTRTPRHREFRKRPSVVVRFSSRWDFRPIRRKILNFSATRRETTRANEWLCGFWPTARRSPHATNTATSPCSWRETGTRRGRRCPHHGAVGGVPIAWVVRTRVRDSRRLRAIPGSKADAGRTRFHPPAPLSGSPHLRPATARPRVVARVARHREHALPAHRAVIARTHRAARGHRRRCRDQCAWDVLAKPETKNLQ